MQAITPNFQKLALIFANSILIIKIKKKNVILNWILYIYFQIWFKKNKIQALIDIGNKVNTMTLVYISKLGFKVSKIDIKA